MRTKTLLLAAGALFAAGLISAQAQPVYSQNVVGYANIVTTNGTPYFMEVPFNIGVSNGANEVWPIAGGNQPEGTTLLVWNGTGFTTYYADPQQIISATGWTDQYYDSNVPPPTIPVGSGFVLIPGGTYTNTFAGTVAVNVGTSNIMVLTNGITCFIGCPVPYAGSVTNGNSSTGGPDLGINSNVPEGTTMLIWTGTTFYTYYADPQQIISATGWTDQYYDSNVTPPILSIGQAFFMIPGGNFGWTVGL